MCVVVSCSINKPNHIRGDRIFFYAVGVGKENGRDAVYGWPLKKYSTLVSECGDANVSTISDAVIHNVAVRFSQITCANVLWIRNCSAYSEPMTSHALGRLAGSRQKLLYT